MAMKKRRILSVVMLLLAVLVLLPTVYCPGDNGSREHFSYLEYCFVAGAIQFGLSGLLTILAACFGLGRARWCVITAGALLLAAAGVMLLLTLRFFGNLRELSQLDWVIFALQLAAGAAAIFWVGNQKYWKN